MFFAIAAVLAFALAILMHCFGWHSGKANVELFTLIGLFCIAMAPLWDPVAWRARWRRPRGDGSA